MKDILIVEDGHQERERLEKLFQSAGYSVQSCGTVGEAEKSVQGETFRVAILDIGLSDKSGSYLFNAMKRGGRVSFIIIFTGNPSVHLKQRFLEEGAVDYVVKGSPQAMNDKFLTRVREVIGTAHKSVPTGMPLEDFLARYVSESSRRLFLDMDNAYPECKHCKSRHYVVVFSNKTQVPPEVKGQVVCASCATIMNLEVE